MTGLRVRWTRDMPPAADDPDMIGTSLEYLGTVVGHAVVDREWYALVAEDADGLIHSIKIDDLTAMMRSEGASREHHADGPVWDRGVK